MGILLKLSHLWQFNCRFDEESINGSQIRLTILVNDKASCDAFNNAFVIFLNALHELLYTSVKLFVEIAIEEFISLNGFVISDFQIFRRKGFSEGIVAVIDDVSFISRGHRYKFTRFALKQVISSDAINKIVLIEFAVSKTFLNDFPLVVEP
jgi:hypothetical protein